MTLTTRRRLKTVVVMLWLSGMIASTHVSGEPLQRKTDSPIIAAGSFTGKGADSAPNDLTCKFDRKGILTYRQQDSEDTLFAFQLRPQLDGADAVPRSTLIMVDTSASQAGQSLAASILIVEQIVKQAPSDDRVAIWTVNVPSATRDLTRGFQKPDAPAVLNALQELRQEVPLGDTDLPSALTRAAKAFDDDTRHRAVVLLGDGVSLHRPLTVAERVQLSAGLVNQRIALFPVPIGPHLDPTNLHGLAISTGGSIIRVQPRDQPRDVVKRLHDAVTVPILYPDEVAFSEEALEHFPTELPPLRGDAPTLMVGRCKPGHELTCEVTGTLAGREVRLRLSEPILEPEADNFFLVSMVAQWRKAKEQPALLRADRALAFTQQLNVLARDELLGQAQMALMLDHVDAAGRLFEQARKLDPSDLEADGGQRLVAMLRDGKLTKQELRKELTRRDGNALLIEKTDQGKAAFRRDAMKNLLAQADVRARDAAMAPAHVPPALDDDALLKQQRLKQAVEEQHLTQLVNDTLRQANRLVTTDPDGANEMVKRVLVLVRDNADLRENVRIGLVNRLENAARNLAHHGMRVQRDQEERLKLLALAESRSAELTAKLTEEDRMRERMRVYRHLMNQARYEDGFNQGLAMLQDAINDGQPVPVAVTAARDIGLAAHNLREVQELRRIRQERFLLTMMQVERSHVPFPDEPPIQFPPAETWRRITDTRKDRYESSGLSDDDPVALHKIKELKDKLVMSVTMDGFEPNTPLQEALGFLSERFGITTLIDVEAFKADLMIQEPENQPVKLPRMVNVSLGTVLRLLLAQAQATFIIRRDYIEITTPQRQAAEKTLRVYPVADLVTPIPNSVNQQAVNQTQSNAFSGAAGASLMGMMGMGGMGLMGLGGLGLGGLGLGGLGMAGMGAPGMGIAGAGQGGGFGGVNGFAGSGAQGIGAGGNLGGQFGLQGGDTSGLLLRLITQVVGKPEDWAPLDPTDAGGVGNAGNAGFGGGFNGNMAGFGGMGMGLPPVDPNEGAGDPNQAGSLGYYPPTRALIVKATSRIHTRLGGGMLGPRPPVEGANADKPPARDVFVIAPGKKLRQVAGAADKQVATRKKPQGDPKRKPLADLDATKIWQDALSRSQTEPGLIIATADFLVERGKFQHAAEFLKANLRHGIVVKPWVYDSLAIALKLSKGSVEEIERAQLSAADVQPQDAQGYVRAAQTMAENRRWDRAVAYCRQASLLEPNSPRPYAEAMIYAEGSKDSEALEWAAGNLLSRDWPADNQELHRTAHERLKALRKLLETEQRLSRAQALEATTRQHCQRDLIIKLTWQGDADLDLAVTEPIGAVCSFLQRQTPGGGTLIGGRVGTSRDETYVAAQGFPGEYTIRVQKIWGSALGSKATLEVVEHDGTPQQRVLLRERVAFERTHTWTVKLATGRRTSVAELPALPPARAARDIKKRDHSLHQLQMLADPDAAAHSGVRGGLGSQQRFDPNPVPSRPATRKLHSFVSSGADMTLQPVFGANQVVIGMSLQPIFQTLGTAESEPGVVNPVVPGHTQR